MGGVYQFPIYLSMFDEMDYLLHLCSKEVKENLLTPEEKEAGLLKEYFCLGDGDANARVTIWQELPGKIVVLIVPKHKHFFKGTRVTNNLVKKIVRRLIEEKKRVERQEGDITGINGPR
jgi:hypothetical protein